MHGNIIYWLFNKKSTTVYITKKKKTKKTTDMSDIFAELISSDDQNKWVLRIFCGRKEEKNFSQNSFLRLKNFWIFGEVISAFHKKSYFFLELVFGICPKNLQKQQKFLPPKTSDNFCKKKSLNVTLRTKTKSCA